MTRYEDDFYGWIQEQRALLATGRLSELDTVNLMEELAAVGRSEYRELVSRLAVLMVHLLKWQYQLERQWRSWSLTIVEQRDALTDVLDDSPSLRARLPEAIQKAYKTAKISAERETGIPGRRFPVDCPWTWEQLMDEGYLPH
ncbi:DUF29 domain-containing protein [Escherichia coli]|nr:DUF29 domain-containing protein [Escherichia coli]EJG7147555.1 DUF29 domain-containing protein [Escherichia coli]